MTPRQRESILIARAPLLAQGWKLLPDFLIRSTGFPFELLESLRMPGSLRWCDALAARRRALDDLRATFNERLFPGWLEQEQRRAGDRATFKAWYRLNHCVHKGQVCPAPLAGQLGERQPDAAAWIAAWNGALDLIAQAETELARVFAAEQGSARARLHEIAQQPRFQEALLLSNPNIYTVALPSYLRAYSPERRPTKLRQLERRLYSYLQRFCAKNDTASFFGPIDYGRCDPALAEPLLLERGETVIARRLSRMAHWAAQALADVIAADPAVRPCLVPRLQDGCALLASGELELTAQRKRVRLPAGPLALVRVIDGVRPLRELWPELDDQANQRLKQLCDQGMVLLRIDIPTAVFDPLGWLRAWVARLPQDCAPRAVWLARLDGLQAQIDTFATAPAADKLALLEHLEQAFSALTGQEARRGEGTIYVDRLLVYDEAQGDIQACVFGPALSGPLLDAIQPALDLCASYSLLIQQAGRERAQELFLELGGGEPLPYLFFIRQLDTRLTLDACMQDAPVQEFLAQLRALAQSRQHDGRIQLQRDDIEHLLRPIPPGTMVSPDLFLAAPDPAMLAAGNYQIVVGEIHYGAQIWCHFLTFSDRRDALAEALAEALPQDRHYATMIHRRQQGKTFYLEPPGLSVEVLGRSTKPRDNVLPVSDLEVIGTPSGLALRSRGHLIELYAGDPRSISNWIFGPPPVIVPPIRLGTYTPQIELDGVVIERARWTLDTADLAPAATLEGPALLAYAAELRARHQLPERCFARVPSERKPFYVDFANLLSIELFFAMLQDNQRVDITELLPLPEDWWLHDAQGRRSCEFRMTMILWAGLP